MSDGAQNLSRRDMMRLGATGVAAASIANLPVLADKKAAPDKLPRRRYGRTRGHRRTSRPGRGIRGGRSTGSVTDDGRDVTSES